MMNSLASSRAMMVLVVGMKMDCFDNRSTTMRIVVEPAEAGSCSMKSIDIEFHSFSGIGSCWRVPYGLWHWDLDCMQVVQDLQ